jgi:ABC-type glycerol-3-phosphate transport system substrate-binding protein
VRRGLALFIFLFVLPSCGGGASKREIRDIPVDEVEIKRPVEVVFWHTQAGSNAEALNKIISDFEATNPLIRIKAEYVGDYTQLYQKIMAAIQAGSPPDMAVSYESMVAEYMKAGVVVPLDEYVGSKRYGLSKESFEDIFPGYIETNRFPQFGGKLLSFPFTKSNLMLYYNLDMIRAAGFKGPPRTWDEFIEQCIGVSKRLGKKGYALSVDPSMVHGMIYSFGGRLVSPDGRRTYFDSPESIMAFKVLERLAKSGAIYQIRPGSRDDENDFANQRVAFVIRSSTGRPFLQKLIGKRFRWGMGLIPQGKPGNKVTVMFGANICIFKTGPEKQLACWEFIKYFTDRERTAYWATVTGYMPVRRSALREKVFRDFLSADPVNRAGIEVLPYARPEPNVPGWQQVRQLVADAETSVITGKATAEEAARRLAREANAVLVKKGNEWEGMGR